MTAQPDFDDRDENLRTPPQSVEAEQAVLGGLMLRPESMPKIADWVAESDFFRHDHRLIFRSISRLISEGKPVDAVTMGEWFEANKLTDQLGRPSYLSELYSGTPSAANVEAYAEIVVEHSRRRQLIDLGTRIVDGGFERTRTAGDVASAAQSALAALSPVRHTGLVAAGAGVTRWWDELLTRVDHPGLLGLPTPWKGLNDATRGLRPGRLYVIAGRPGMGKSILGGQLAAFTALRGIRSALFSLEMSEEEIHQRNIAALAGVPHDFLDAPGSESPHWDKLHPAINALRHAPLLVDDTAGLTAGQLCARAERAHLQAPLGLIVVDHLHEMAFDPRDRANSIGEGCRRLKAVGKRLNVPVVILAQLNRESAKNGGLRPTLTDLRASGEIEQVADVILFVHREDYYRPETHLRDVVEVILAKGRNIRSGRTVHLLNCYDQMRADDWTGPLPQPPAHQADGDDRPRGFGRKGKVDHKSAAAADARIQDVTRGGL